MSAHTRESVQIVTGTTKLHQKIVQSIRAYYNYTEIKYSSKYIIELKMKIVSLNCQSWTTAKDSVKTLVHNYNLDLICLSETWEKDSKLVQFGSWPVLSKPRNNNSGHGGVTILCKPSDEFYISRRTELENTNIE